MLSQCAHEVAFRDGYSWLGERGNGIRDAGGEAAGIVIPTFPVQLPPGRVLELWRRLQDTFSRKLDKRGLPACCVFLSNDSLDVWLVLRIRKK